MDIYAAAQHRLREKVPRVVSQQEYDEFHALGSSIGSYLEASKLLESLVLSEELADGRFLQFYRKLGSLLEPLRFLQSALDTLCQAHSAFTLLWGSVKSLMKASGAIHYVALWPGPYASRCCVHISRPLLVQAG